MKKSLPILLCCLPIISICVSCRWHAHDNNVNLTISESEHQYKVLAHYPENNTNEVAAYLNRKIGNRSNVSFTNTIIDAELTLDDGTKLYMKNGPGDLEIKFNKDENSAGSYDKIKALGEELKPILSQ